MSILGWILFGLVVGVVAKLLMPGRDPGGMIVTILLGIGGALVGGFLGRMLGWYGEADPVGFLMAVMGAILVLFVFRKLSGPPRGRNERRLMT
ncbi:MAG: GlsB/YeaQ/YmgE family stress response membrane protein [Nitrospirota bacterium]